MLEFKNGEQRRLEARGPIWYPTGRSLCSQHSKLKIKDIVQFLVAYSAPLNIKT